MLLSLDKYIIKHALSFAELTDIYMLYETCKDMKNLVNHFHLEKESLYMVSVLKDFKTIKWAESHPSFYYPEDAMPIAI